MAEQCSSTEEAENIWQPQPAPVCEAGGPPVADVEVDPTSYVSYGPPAPDEDVRLKYQQQAYEKLGLKDQAEFDGMDKVDRNQLVTGAYAQMYLSDPDTYKWAGMAAYASDKAGTGMMGAGAVGALSKVDGDEMGTALEEGNKAIFQDLYWQHLAFQNGGVDELQKAYEQGAVTEEQLEGWKQLADAQKERQAAVESGDDGALADADEKIWGANKGLLRHEQEVVLQDGVYDNHRELFADLSDSYLIDAVDFGSPVPGDDSAFEDGTYSDGKTPDIGNFDHRWEWIENQMLPAYQDHEINDHETMLENMRAYADRSRSGCPVPQGEVEGGPPSYEPAPPCPPAWAGNGGEGGAGAYGHYSQ